jgi:hypothetical protein
VITGTILVLVNKLPTNFGIACSSDNFFFILPPWYKYLDLAPDDNGYCTVQNFSFPADLLPVGFAVLDMLIRLAGLVAVVMVIFAGVSYMTAQGNAEKAASARRRIYQSLIGLVIVFVAAGFVSFIGNKLS